MKLKSRRNVWGWGVRVDKDGNLHDSFVVERAKSSKYRTKWRVRKRRVIKLRLAQAFTR